MSCEHSKYLVLNFRLFRDYTVVSTKWRASLFPVQYNKNNVSSWVKDYAGFLSTIKYSVSLRTGFLFCDLTVCTQISPDPHCISMWELGPWSLTEKLISWLLLLLGVIKSFVSDSRLSVFFPMNLWQANLSECKEAKFSDLL